MLSYRLSRRDRRLKPHSGVQPRSSETGTPNIAFERDAPKAARPSTLRYQPKYKKTKSPHGLTVLRAQWA